MPAGNKYVKANETDIWIAPIPSGETTPTEHTITLSAAALANAITLAVDATSVKLYDRQVLNFDGTYVTLMADANVGATSLSIKALSAGLSDGDIAVTYGYLPVYSAESADFEKNGESVTAANFQTGVFDYMTILGRNWRIPVSGTLDTSDPALATLEAATEAIGDEANIGVLLVNPAGMARGGIACVENLTLQHQHKNLIKVNFNLVGIGAPTRESYAA